MAKMIDPAQKVGPRMNANHLDPAVIAATVEISWYKNNLLRNTEPWYEYHGQNIDVYFWWY
jgi:hypothetical protein